ncbi:cactin-like isoform X1 [Hibiscus syriacus]|uniref:Cactin-like isoform X1 n=1 Tax=Hibiscus syriacus TaxID=106335 RepID=A0A6A2XWR6_HIBSY|nr:NDR1/HIN1-like protein 6 [Hibiscus syriacus]KAE8666516.1 cactin-like isoform X1 [Hibiscus syriacus]
MSSSSMAEQQKIHPVPDIESPPQTSPTAPLVPLGSTKSDLVNPVEQHHQSNYSHVPPISHPRPPKKRSSCCCRCLCWTLSILLLLIGIIGIIIGILFLVLRPKLPYYSIDGLEVTQLSLSSNSSLSANLHVNFTARNPNRRIEIYYEGGSHITVWYTETQLCRGSIPKFYQGHRNTTVLVLPMSGQIQNGAGLLTALQQQQQQTGNIPLLLRARQPVRIKLGSLKLPEMKFLVRCWLVVDALSPNRAIRISSSSCSFRFRL